MFRAKYMHSFVYNGRAELMQVMVHNVDTHLSIYLVDRVYT